jgi:hypothetical protein
MKEVIDLLFIYKDKNKEKFYYKFLLTIDLIFKKINKQNLSKKIKLILFN